ncbi:MAG TPA: hypothetical protein VKD72_16110, partial [Gemmataceae bacterium]|nr:hypothetical protein [Gemmataceae bacterium]
SRQALASAADQVGQLEVYKRLHELLHKVQFRLFYQLENAARRFKTDPVANDLLANYISDLRDRAKEARPLAGALPDLPAARGLEFVWITEFDDTVAKLAAGRDALDDRQVLAGVRRLKSLLTVHPPRLNQLLALIAGTLPIRQLLDAFSAVIAAPDGAIAVRAARDGLVGLQPRLQAAVAEHTRWQELEKDLWLMENNLLDRAPQGRQADVPEVWNEIKLKITALRDVDPNAPWATAIGTLASAADAALAVAPPAPELPDPALFKFRDYRRTVLEQFVQVDDRLMQVCADVIPLGKPLRDLSEEVRNAD